jgi:hypothetical protein
MTDDGLLLVVVDMMLACEFRKSVASGGFARSQEAD